MDKKQRKLNFEKEDKRQTKKTELQEANVFGPFYKTKAQKRRKKHQKQKTDQKTPFRILANNPLFLVNFCFFRVTLFHVCKAAFR